MLLASLYPAHLRKARWPLAGIAALASIASNPVFVRAGEHVLLPADPAARIESGEKRLGQWVNERRNTAEDFRCAFGKDPPDLVKTIALFSDDDRTGQPVVSYYGALRAV